MIALSKMRNISFIIIGLFLTAMSASMCKTQLDLFRGRLVCTKGTVQKLQTSFSSSRYGTGKFCNITYSFIAAGKDRVDSSSYVGISPLSSLQVGGEIDVYYSAENPEYSYPLVAPRLMNNVMALGLFFLLGVLLFGAGVYALYSKS